MRFATASLTFFVLGNLIAPETTFARFGAQDADFIDREDRPGTASYHDANFYRFTRRLRERWVKKEVGYRVTDGSFDADRSRIHEQIKMATSYDKPVALAFDSDKFHDLLNNLHTAEGRIIGITSPGVYFATLADGTTSYKAFGDLGAALGYGTSHSNRHELYYYSVDHFYNSKNTELGQFTEKPLTYGARSLYSGDSSYYYLEVEQDQPVSWNRPSEGYTYDYKLSTVKGETFFHPAEQLELYVRGWYEWKSEAKVFDSGYQKAMDRRAQDTDLAVTYLASELTYYSLGMRYIKRDASYRHTISATSDLDTVPEYPSPDTKRREFIVYQISNFPMNDASWAYFQLGLSQSWVDIAYDYRPDRSLFVDAAALQQKLQTGFSFQVDNLDIFLHASLDVDGLRRDWPFETKPTHGDQWDGGGVQFQMTF